MNATEAVFELRSQPGQRVVLWQDHHNLVPSALFSQSVECTSFTLSHSLEMDRLLNRAGLGKEPGWRTLSH